jgi:hypothetical protein
MIQETSSNPNAKMITRLVAFTTIIRADVIST